MKTTFNIKKRLQYSGGDENNAVVTNKRSIKKAYHWHKWCRTECLILLDTHMFLHHPAVSF